MVSKSFKYFLAVLFIGLLVRLFLSQFYTSWGDLLSFKIWGGQIVSVGFRDFYQSVWSDYLPGYLYIAAFLNNLQTWLVNHSINAPDSLIYKIPSILADFGNSYLIFLIARKFSSEKKAIFASLVFYLSPAFWINSTLWGQADSFMTLFLLSSFYCLVSGKLWLSAILLGLGQTVKPISIFSFPFFVLFLYLQKVSLPKIVTYISLFGITAILLFVPFNNSNNLFQFIFERHAVTANQYPYTTVNAINFWSIISDFWKSDQTIFLTLTLQDWGHILFGGFYLFLAFYFFIKFKHSKNKILFLAFTITLSYLAMYLFMTRMHERHMFYGLSFATLLLPITSFSGIALLGIGLMVYFFDLAYAFFRINQGSLLFGHTSIVILSFFYLVLFGNILWGYFKKVL